MLIFAFSLKHRPQLLPQAQELPLYLGWWEGTLPSSSLHMASPGQRKAAPPAGRALSLLLLSYLEASTEPVTGSRV